MEISLNILSDQEFELYNTTIALQGNIEQKSEQMERLAIALKRLAFLNWYVQSEPGIYTGLGDFNRDVMFNSYAAINDLLQSNSLDQEFKWMLSFYSCWEWTILDLIDNKLNYLEGFVKNVDPTAKHVPGLTIRKVTMNRRGQMGIYFMDFGYTDS